jgi:hypothetical protein
MTPPNWPTPPDDSPDALKHYLAMWNERDHERIRGHLDQCVADDCWWVDPLHQHRGRDALEANVREFRATYADAQLGLGSAIDSHNGRHRYEWVITTGGAAGDPGDVLIRGFDVSTVNDSGLIDRVDGFFWVLDRTGPGA